jgi:ubiquinone/menaquinone biosynthesis C-methylase UbiE
VQQGALVPAKVRVGLATSNRRRFNLISCHLTQRSVNGLARVVSAQHGRSIGAEKHVMTKHASTQHAEVLEDGTRTGKETVYVLGHSQDEIGRLIDQAAIVRPTTERLLRNAGIERGMRVLDLGCGAGDVSMLAGKLVGPSGSVVGIDPNADILFVARARAQADGLLHVNFTEASVGTFSDPRPFDLVVARYVLPYQVDPVVFLRAAAGFAAPGGILALHEFIVDRPLPSRPHVALSQPALFSETPVGGGVDAPHYAWLAGLVRTLLPRMIESGVVTAETVAIDTLESRVRSAVVEARSQVWGAAQVCAWTRV